MTGAWIPDSLVTQLVELISNETGLRFDGHHLETVRKGIRAAMERSGEHDPSRFLQHISSNSPVFDDLVSELTIGETYFFREPAQFAVIRHELIPALTRAKGPDHRVRIWSAGCATGEEPYSIAMLLHEMRILERSHVLATDISHHALAKARTGNYRSWSIRGSDNPLLKKFLQQEGNDYVVDQRLRSHVVFEYLNLALDNYPSFANGTWGLDLILCRNVLIYFDRATIAAVAKRFYECLSPGGCVVLGASDPRISDHAPFEVRMTDSGLVYSRPDVASPMSSAQSPLSRSELFPSSTFESSKDVDAPVARSAGVADLRSAESSPATDRTIAAKSKKPATTGLDEQAIRELAKVDAVSAERRCAEAVAHHPISVELRFLHAVLLLELERNAEAVEAARRVVFLDRELEIAHMTLGTALQRTGQNAAARRSFRNAHQLCAARPATDIIPLSDGEHAGRLALSAQQHLALLEGT